MAFHSIAILTSTCVVTLAITTTTVKYRDSEEFFQEMCLVFAEEPSFNIDKLYDIWLNDLMWNTRDVPFDLLVFINCTSDDVRKVKKDMGNLLITQPDWSTAKALMVDQQQSRPWRRMMLFPDPNINIPGRFIGVPNYREVNSFIPIKKKSIFFARLQMLMLANSTYLLVMDCDTGEASVNHRDILEPIYSYSSYMAGFRIPFPVRYSHLYTGIKIPDIPADHPPELLM